ncbi:MAG: type IV secretory system conjugative DNA transfer family protein [Gammaproteobacteria bacterium]
MNNPLHLLRGFRAHTTPIKRGQAPEVRIPEKIPFSVFGGIMLTLIVCFVVYGIMYLLLGGVFKLPKKDVYYYANTVSGIASLLVFAFYYFQPIFSFFFFVVITRKKPPADIFAHHHFLQKTFSLLLIAFVLLSGFNMAYPRVMAWWQSPMTATVSKPDTTQPKTPKKKSSAQNPATVEAAYKAPITDNAIFFTWWMLITGLLGVVITGFLHSGNTEDKGGALLHRPKALKNASPLPFSLWVGQATGQLAARSHGTGIASKTNVTLSLADAAQNMLVLGAIGSGKTTRAIHPLLIQLLDQGCGGLIFDVKGDFKQAVHTFSEMVGKKPIVIGPLRSHMNVLSGLTPEVAASFLKSAFLLSNNKPKDAFWMDTATELCRNALGVLTFLPDHYSLHGLYNYLFDTEYKTERHHELDDIKMGLSDTDARLLKTYQSYQTRIFNPFQDSVKSNVNATVAQVLAPFNHPDLIDAFCTESRDSARMEDVLNGTVYLVDMPLSVWGLGGKVAYTFIKLRFFNVMQQRSIRPEWDQQRPAFFMCDEFQEIVSASRDGLSDLNFWDKSRSSKTIGIISGQSVSSFYAAIGDRDITHALLQNFRQKICFKTDDLTTLELLNRLIGNVEVSRLSYGHSAGTSDNGEFLSPEATNESHSTNLSYTDKAVLDAQLIRGMGENQAVALLSIQGHSMDDVLNMQPVYL